MWSKSAKKHHISSGVGDMQKMQKDSKFEANKKCSSDQQKLAEEWKENRLKKLPLTFRPLKAGIICVDCGEITKVINIYI